MVHEAMTVTEKNTSDIRQFIKQHYSLLMTPISAEPKYITAPGEVILKAMCKTLVLVFTQATGLAKVVLHKNVANHHACMRAKRIMDGKSRSLQRYKRGVFQKEMACRRSDTRKV